MQDLGFRDINVCNRHELLTADRIYRFRFCSSFRWHWHWIWIWIWLRYERNLQLICCRHRAFWRRGARNGWKQMHAWPLAGYRGSPSASRQMPSWSPVSHTASASRPIAAPNAPTSMISTPGSRPKKVSRFCFVF
jgi:hypothetical protein